MLCFVCVLGLLCASALSAQAAEPLRIATEDDYFPFSYRQADGSLAGFDVDISKALCARMQRECTIIPMPFSDLIPAAKSGKVDLIVAGLAKNAEREQQLTYIVPYYRSRTAIVGEAGKQLGLVNQDTLRGKRIAAQLGSVQHEYVLQNYGAVATIIPTITVRESFTLLQNGAVDVLFADSLVCMAFLIQGEALNLDYVASPLSAEHESSQAFIAAPPGNNALVQQVRKAFSRLRSSDEFYTINRKYFPFSIY